MKDDSEIFEINASQNQIYSVLLTEDGKTILSGGVEGVLRRWRVDDGHEVGEPIKIENAEIFVMALSPDENWLVCGLRHLKGNNGKTNVRVWNARTYEKALDIHGHTDSIFSVDISSDSRKIISGSCDKQAIVWSITTGERLLGPLQHDQVVLGVRFSPNSDRIATVAGERESKPTLKSIFIYNSDDGQKLLEIPFTIEGYCISRPLAWSADGCRLFAAACGQASCFDASSGSLLNKWTIPGGRPASIAVSHNQKFIVVSTLESVSLWDASSYKQIGSTVKYASTVWSTALSSNDDCIATGEKSGSVIFRDLRKSHPGLYFTVNIPLAHINDAVFKSWTAGDLSHVEELLTKEVSHLSDNSFYTARSLAHRALVRARLKHWKMAIDDAEKSIETQRSTIGHIARALSHIGNGEKDLAMRQVDLMFGDCLPNENKFLLLIKAIILFECGKHDEGILRVEDLMHSADDRSLHTIVRARMLFFLGSILMRKGDNTGAIELFKRAQEAIPFQQSSHLVTISLVFGWDFDGLSLAIQLRVWKAMQAMGDAGVTNSLSTMREALGEDALTSEVTADWDPELVQKCAMAFEKNGDAVRLDDPKEAVARYSIALSLNPSNPTSLFVKRSRAKVKLGLWDDALKDSDEAIKVDPINPWGYEQRHAALHGLHRFDEAISAFTRMLSLIKESPDENTRQLLKNYTSPAESHAAIDSAVQTVVRICPLVLIDVKSGRLCDAPDRKDTFKNEPEFQELVSSMTVKLDDELIREVVAKYFEYVTLSHVWGGKEPLFQDVTSANSVWNLASSPLNDKLRRFCEVVRDNGYRWAWSDTCCIDKTISTVLNQSLTMMYKWYQSCAATFIFLADVDSPSVPGTLTNSIWLTRAWAAQELLAPKVIRFHDRDWKPYLGDMRFNHKESPEIMQELANAIGISREMITSFNPDDLSILEKLRLASRRNATIEEDIAYSLMGIFKSDIMPRYGEGDAALGHLLEEIVARSGDVVVLSWTGTSSQYNSCLPSSLSVYYRVPYAPPSIDDSEVELRITQLRESLSSKGAMDLYRQITRLPPVRFSNRRLYLPSIVFAVRRLGVQNFGDGQEAHYRARVSGIGHVEFQTSDKLSLTEPRKLVFVHPWIRDLRPSFDGLNSDDMSDDDRESDSGSDSDGSDSPSASPLLPRPPTQTDGYTRALQLIVRLQEPFHALLLQQQPSGAFKRVAAEQAIVIPGLERRHFGDIRTEVVEVL